MNEADGDARDVNRLKAKWHDIEKYETYRKKSGRKESGRKKASRRTADDGDAARRGGKQKKMWRLENNREGAYRWVLTLKVSTYEPTAFN